MNDTNLVAITINAMRSTAGDADSMAVAAIAAVLDDLEVHIEGGSNALGYIYRIRKELNLDQ